MCRSIPTNPDDLVTAQSVTPVTYMCPCGKAPGEHDLDGHKLCDYCWIELNTMSEIRDDARRDVHRRNRILERISSRINSDRCAICGGSQTVMKHLCQECLDWMEVVMALGHLGKAGTMGNPTLDDLVIVYEMRLADKVEQRKGVKNEVESQPF